MPLGKLSDEEYEEELKRLSGKRSTVKESHPVIVEKPPHGRKDGDNNVPESLRKIISETHLTEGRAAALALAGSFGISASSVSAYVNGATSTKTYDTPNKSLIGHVNKTRERIVGRASKTLKAALGAISQDKLDYSDAKDLSSIAKDMSVIIKNMEPQRVTDDSQASPVQFTIFAPQFRDERSFETINVNE